MKISDEQVNEYVRTFGGIMRLDPDAPAPVVAANPFSGARVRLGAELREDEAVTIDDARPHVRRA
jgi:hypothetical protein